MKYIFWDFNGTILDDARLCFDILNEMLVEEHRKKVSYEEYLNIFDFPIEAYYAKVFDLSQTSYQDLAHRFIQKYKPRSLYSPLHEDAIETLVFFKDQGIKNVLLSASETKNLKEQLHHFDIYWLFDDVLGTNDVYAQSKVDIAKAYIHNRKIDPNDVIIIGDTLHDAEVAQEIDCKIIIFTKGHQHINRLKAFQTIDHLKELKKMINQSSYIIK